MTDIYYTIDQQSFVWDEQKNKINVKKHGIDFETAALVFNDDLRLEYPDIWHSGKEERYITIGCVHKVIFVVYCDRRNKITGETYTRLISARLANKTEIQAYTNGI